MTKTTPDVYVDMETTGTDGAPRIAILIDADPRDAGSKIMALLKAFEGKVQVQVLDDDRQGILIASCPQEALEKLRGLSGTSPTTLPDGPHSYDEDSWRRADPLWAERDLASAPATAQDTPFSFPEISRLSAMMAFSGAHRVRPKALDRVSIKRTSWADPQDKRPGHLKGLGARITSPKGAR